MPLPALTEQEANGKIYVNLTELPDVYRNRVGCTKNLDRTKLVTLHTCCSQYHEFIEKDYFLEIVQPII